MLVKVIALALTAFLSVPVLARAQTIPLYDIDGECQRFYEIYNLSKNACIYQNQQSYDRLKKYWPDLPDNVKVRSLDLINKQTRKDYMVLESYVVSFLNRDQQSRDNEEINNSNHFQQ